MGRERRVTSTAGAAGDVSEENRSHTDDTLLPGAFLFLMEAVRKPTVCSLMTNENINFPE